MAESADAAVACRGITKEYGSGATLVRALRGVDLDVYAGELTLLAGPSGCGKTTLLSVIAGILEPTEGMVRVLGADLRDSLRHKRSASAVRTSASCFNSSICCPPCRPSKT